MIDTTLGRKGREARRKLLMRKTEIKRLGISVDLSQNLMLSEKKKVAKRLLQFNIMYVYSQTHKAILDMIYGYIYV